MNRLLLWLCVVGLLPLLGGCAAKESAAPSGGVTEAPSHLAADGDVTPEVPPARPAPVLFAQDVAPLLAKYCLACHDSARARGGLVLETFHDDASVRQALPLWQKVAGELRAGSMPPAGKPQPTAAELELLNAWLDAAVFPRNSTTEKDPYERVTVRRLNRAEYNNTVRDLVGLDLHPAEEFPADDVGYGFDNIGDVLSLPPLLLEKYLSAAEQVVDAAFRSPEIRQRLLNPPPDDVVPPAYRGFVQPVRAEARKVLRTGPADAPPTLDPREREIFHAYSVLRAFADRAYRRPATHDELTRLLRFVEAAQRNGEGYEQSIRLALRAVLVSPHFLFRFESNGETARPLTDFELATRLSYFLWSSLPDEELFRLAARGALRRGNTLAAQVRRMLRDEKARALVQNFGGQWLQTRGLKDFAPDPAWFPNFDEALRAAMLRETDLFFEAVVGQDRSVLEFLDADYTFVNERLARHYGIPGVRGAEFRRVSLAGTPRGGLLTQASVLAVTSHPTRTSPVKRGKWVLETLLGAPPPPPPPGVEDLKDGDKVVLSGSLRQRMEQHRTNPSCAACHARMDPLGFGLENFDALGAWRTHDGLHPIDASGTLPGGQSFDGPAELRAVLKARRQAFARCLAEKLLTYALGRGVEPSDGRAVDAIARRLARNDYRFSALVLAVVQSEPFQTRGARGGEL
jgi:Protein of unknown function (DUF1592)/Protein of unknown function (DUF1588)/Protein of unknown function (DUF1585)/Protein of unknown function (DUF1587)/Protein of unknown function (DUF1595)/Planctomycete cytochrome C